MSSNDRLDAQQILLKRHDSTIDTRQQTLTATSLLRPSTDESEYVPADLAPQIFECLLEPVPDTSPLASALSTRSASGGDKSTNVTIGQTIAHKTPERLAGEYKARLDVHRAIDQAVLSGRSTEAITQIALHHLEQIIPHSVGIVSLPNLDASTTILLAADVDDATGGQGDNQVRIQTQESPGPPGQHNDEKLENLPDSQQSSELIDILQRWHIRILFSIPLTIEGQSIGVLSLGVDNANPPNPAYVDIARDMARVLTVALHHSRLREEAKTRRTQLQRLTQQLIAAQEEERQRLSRVLHDEIGQALITLTISLGLLQDDLPTHLSALHRRLDNAVSLTATTIEQIRSLAHELRPPALDAAGLQPALQGFCDEFARHTRLAIVFTGTDKLPALSDSADICLYRFLQESLTNVAKHAHARHVYVTLHHKSGIVSLIVQDDGRGFDGDGRLSANSWPMGIGLLDMRERLESLGGRLKIESQPGKGACLTAYLPTDEGDSEETP